MFELALPLVSARGEDNIKRFFNIILAFLFFAGCQIFAQGGFDHVTGILITMDKNVLIVRTAKGDVRVMIESKTKILLREHAGQVSDLKPGLRVVVDVSEGSKIKVAHSVKIGTSGE